MAFHPYPQLIRGILKFPRFGLSHCFTNASTWSRVDHHRFGCACCDDAFLDSLSLCVLRMDYAATTDNSQTHYAKGRPSPTRGFDTLNACGCRNYFTPLTAVLFTFPSRYCFTIGHCFYLALRHGRRGFVRNFTWIVLLRVSLCLPQNHLRAYHSLWGIFPDASLILSGFNIGTLQPRINPVWAGPLSFATTYGIAFAFSHGY